MAQVQFKNKIGIHKAPKFKSLAKKIASEISLDIINNKNHDIFHIAKLKDNNPKVLLGKLLRFLRKASKPKPINKIPVTNIINEYTINIILSMRQFL